MLSALKVVAAALPAVAAILGLVNSSGRMRKQIRDDIELLDKLPADSEAHERLLSHIAGQVETLISWRETSKRDWSGLSVGVVITGLFGVGAWWLFGHGRFWTSVLGALSLVVAALGLFGISESIARVPRDDKGRRLTE